MRTVARHSQTPPSEHIRSQETSPLALEASGSAHRLDRVTVLAKRLLGGEAAIHLLDHERQLSLAQTHDLARSVPRSLSLCDVTVQQHGTVVVPDTRQDDRFRDHPSVSAGLGIRSYLAHPLRGPGGEIIGTLCVAGTTPRSFTPDQVELIQDLAQWAEEELNLAQEMAKATQVQRSLLPASLVSFPGYEIAGVSRPVHAVGGDFYDWYPVRGGVALTMADVMGKGMPAALIAAGVRAVMRANAPVHGVAAAVESAAEALETELDGAGAFVTLFHAHLTEQTGVIRYIDAGHGLSMVVRDDGTSERLGSTGMPIGANWDNTWDEATTRLFPGDTLLSVSDGVLDGLGGALDSLAALEEIARDAPDATSAAQLVADAVGPSAPDDVSVIALRRTAVRRLDVG
jgi:hypothetical protein